MALIATTTTLGVLWQQADDSADRTQSQLAKARLDNEQTRAMAADEATARNRAMPYAVGASTAIVVSTKGSVFTVHAYVSIKATNLQAPQGRETLTVYTVTMDKAKNWQITDVGGTVCPGK